MTNNQVDSGDQPLHRTDLRKRLQSVNQLTQRRTFLGMVGTGAVGSAMGIGSATDEQSEGEHVDSGEGERETFDVEQTHVQLDDNVYGGLYEPTEETDRSHIGFVFIHPEHDFTTGWRNEIAERHGYRALGVSAHSRIRGQFKISDLLPDLGLVVRFLSDLPEVESIILGGHSGGGHLSALYQNVAENGVEIGQGDEKISPLPDYLHDEDLPAADGLILIDAHIGYAGKGLIDLGPQIVDEKDGRIRNPKLDMLNPDNGYNPEEGEASSYTDEFLERFYQGQADRMNRLVERNLGRLQQMEEGEWRYPDDEEFMFLDNRSRVFRPDPSILAHTQDEWPLIHAEDSEVSDDREVVEQIHSIRGVEAPDYEPPFTYEGRETEPSTVRTWLDTRAIRPTEDYQLTESSIEGIDWHSANAQTPGNLETISVPLLITPTTGHRFVVQGELFYNHAGSSDKTLLYIEGGDHGFSPIGEEFGDTRRAVFNTWNQWAVDRFL